MHRLLRSKVPGHAVIECTAWVGTHVSRTPSFLWSTSRPGTLHSTLFFTESFSSFRNTCPYYRNLFCCRTEIMSSNSSLSLNPLLGILSCSFTPHIHLTILAHSVLYIPVSVCFCMICCDCATSRRPWLVKAFWHICFSLLLAVVFILMYYIYPCVCMSVCVFLYVLLCVGVSVCLSVWFCMFCHVCVYVSSGRHCGWMKRTGTFSSLYCLLLSCFCGDLLPTISGLFLSLPLCVPVHLLICLFVSFYICHAI